MQLCIQMWMHNCLCFWNMYWKVGRCAILWHVKILCRRIFTCHSITHRHTSQDNHTTWHSRWPPADVSKTTCNQVCLPSVPCGGLPAWIITWSQSGRHYWMIEGTRTHQMSWNIDFVRCSQWSCCLSSSSSHCLRVYMRIENTLRPSDAYMRQ